MGLRPGAFYVRWNGGSSSDAEGWTGAEMSAGHLPTTARPGSPRSAVGKGTNDAAGSADSCTGAACSTGVEPRIYKDARARQVAGSPAYAPSRNGMTLCESVGLTLMS